MNDSPWPNPLVRYRSDPSVLLHGGQYYFASSVMEYDRLELRRASSLEGLNTAKPVVVWRKPDSGPMSLLIWAPELHNIQDKWYLYFSATSTHEMKGNTRQHRMFVLECSDPDPLTGKWTDKGQIKTALDTFSLDATVFVLKGKLWYTWSQKTPNIESNSNIYLSEMANPWTLIGKAVLLSKPDYEWEKQGYPVNEAPAAVTHGNRIFISYSASATDKHYCLGLLWADITDDLLNAESWHKSPDPVFMTHLENQQYGPGHNSFTKTPDGQDVLVYHARMSTEGEGDPAYCPCRHTRAKIFHWDDNGMPQFGVPPPDHP
ncbi:family 43 glycosylhydrolase [Franconibacter sp. IITDAS19]|uniref:glycoside hydrolase family 43 protein n=1 Tax=Franconibacter TaxID=1649295 RepID=UPI0016698EFA|nr:MULTISPECIES: family 43 glycosylhydrolase [Franconibacter]MCK1969496.1 family 43 glycosylhydrolase [Franconibacter sp. IITDAS19]GGD28127.1 glycosyl hydrolase [Franconibacter daqui]